MRYVDLASQESERLVAARRVSLIESRQLLGHEEDDCNLGSVGEARQRTEISMHLRIVLLEASIVFEERPIARARNAIPFRERLVTRQSLFKL